MNSGAASQEMPPRHDRYLEDYRPGGVYEFGPLIVSEAQIVAFARDFDPQPIHLDRDFAAKGRFGGIIASGWHTAALAMRLYVDHFLTEVASLASPGVDELRWLEPVRPGDSLSVRITILEARASQSKPSQGLIRNLVEVLNQHGQRVMSVKVVSFVGRRPGTT